MDMFLSCSLSFIPLDSSSRENLRSRSKRHHLPLHTPHTFTRRHWSQPHHIQRVMLTSGYSSPHHNNDMDVHSSLSHVVLGWYDSRGF